MFDDNRAQLGAIARFQALHYVGMAGAGDSLSDFYGLPDVRICHRLLAGDAEDREKPDLAPPSRSKVSIRPPRRDLKNIARFHKRSWRFSTRY